MQVNLITKPEWVKYRRPKVNGPLSKIWKRISVNSHCCVFIFYYTWSDFPTLYIVLLMIVIFDPINIFPFVVIIILPN